MEGGVKGVTWVLCVGGKLVENGAQLLGEKVIIQMDVLKAFSSKRVKTPI